MFGGRSAGRQRIVVCSIGPVNADFAIYRTKKTDLGELLVLLERLDFQDFLVMARPGLEPGTPRFSVVCSTN
jgi:hypothetical protein